MAFDTINSNLLIVVDSFYGIFEVDLRNGNRRNLVSQKAVIGKEVNGISYQAPNALLMRLFIESTSLQNL